MISGGDTHLAAARHLDAVLHVYESSNIKASAKKLELGLEHMKVLGYYIQSRGNARHC